MNAFFSILRFEIRYRLGRPATWIYFLILFLLVFGATASDTVQIGGPAGNVVRNSPFLITSLMVFMTSLGIMITSALMSNPVYRDVEYHSTHFLYAYPFTRTQYLLGRFFGSWLITLLVFSSIPLGIYIGSIVAPAMDWIPADKMGPNLFGYYFLPFLQIVVVNTLVVGAIFFALVSLTRKVVYAYTANIILLVLYLIGVELMSDLSEQNTIAILDPLGINLLSVATRYWTQAEQNTRTLAFEGVFMWNRILWLGISMSFLAFTVFRFKFHTAFQERKRKKVSQVEPELEFKQAMQSNPIPSHFDRSFFAYLRQLPSAIKLYVLEVVRDIPFIGIVFSGLVLVVLNLSNLDSLYQTTVYPRTYVVAETLISTFSLFMQIFIVFFTGELIWKERKQGMFLIYDSLPVPDWFQPVAKFFAMLTLTVLLQTLLILMGIITQVAMGFTEIDFGHYVQMFFGIQLWSLAFWIVLGLFVQTLVADKFAGFFVMAAVYIGKIALELGKVSHPMYDLFSSVNITYSEINGFGHYLTAWLWFKLYWSAFAMILLVGLILFSRRGADAGWKDRFHQSGQRLRSPNALVLGISLLVFVITAVWMYKNINVYNRFLFPDEQEKEQVLYERQYKRWEMKAQPKITAVDLQVDLFPYQRRVQTRATLILKNKTTQPIDSILWIRPDEFMKMDIQLSQAKCVIKDPKGLEIWKLASSLLPGDSITMKINTELAPHGFGENGDRTRVQLNGTFLNNTDILPSIGYSRNFEISDKSKRRKYGLPARNRQPDVDDSAALRNNLIASDADWIRFAITLSTDSSQIAMAPGYLKKTWLKDNRRFYRYEMDAPIQNFYSILSGRYAVKKDQDAGIAYEIWYSPLHAYNLDRMMMGMKDAIKYCSEAFSPFQYRQMRIVEFPRYASFAQSFPNTVPFSEGIGFIAQINKPEKIDYVYYVTAHEVAHQWWGHQLAAADAQGAAMLEESLAQYSALMIMERKYGRDQMRKFLQYELDDYLQGRKFDPDKEQPLFRCEDQQFLHYNKGSLVFYALKEYWGEQNLNQFLNNYLKKVAFQGPPFAGSRDFMKSLHQAVPDSLQSLVFDLFESITVYSNKAEKATAKKLSDGKYALTLKVKAEKFRVDSIGNEKPIKFEEWIEVGVVGKEKQPGQTNFLALKKCKILPGINSITFILNELPEKAGIDPRNYLIDRDSEDNFVAVEMLK